MTEHPTKERGMTPLDLYVWTVKTLGVPAKMHLRDDGSLEMEGPYTKLDPAAESRVLARAEELCPS